MGFGWFRVQSLGFGASGSGLIKGLRVEGLGVQGLGLSDLPVAQQTSHFNW